MVADLLFYLFAGVLMVGALGVVMAKNPVHAVLFMVLTFFNAAGLFLLLGAEFLALLLLMVYVGAIAVMFLFVLMTINIDDAARKETFARSLPLGIMVAVVLLVQMVVAASSGLLSGLENTRFGLISTENHLSNIEQFGLVLFDQYAYPFIAVSFVLLTAMVGAIVLTYRRRNISKRQDIPAQIARKNEIRLVTPPSGAGLKEKP